MERVMILLISFSLGSCASTLKVTEIESGKKYLVRCNEPEFCYENANKLCSSGYNTTSSNMVMPDGMAGTGFKQTLIEINCK